MTEIAGREVAHWVSVSAFLTGMVEPWPDIEILRPFFIAVGTEFARPGQVVVRELDGSLSIEDFPRFSTQP